MTALKSSCRSPVRDSAEEIHGCGEYCKYGHIRQAIAKANPWNKQTNKQTSSCSLVERGVWWAKSLNFRRKVVQSCGEMKANVLGLGVLPRLTHHQLLDRDGAEQSTAHHKQKNSQPLLKKGWRSPRFWTLQPPPQPCQHHDFYFLKKIFF